MEKIVITILGSEVFLYFVKELVTWLKERKKKPSAIENGLMWLLRDKLEYHMVKYLNQGYVTKEQRDFVNHGYSYYKGLGGNGDMAELKEDFDELEVQFKGDKKL